MTEETVDSSIHDDDFESEDQILDLSGIAPPRLRVRPPSGGPIVTLRSPNEFGVREQARLQSFQGEIGKLQRANKLTADQLEKLSQIFHKVTRMILVDVDEDDLSQLTDSDEEALAMVFTGRWIDYTRKLAAEGGEETMAVLNSISGSSSR